jgi:hypothetical protein
LYDCGQNIVDAELIYFARGTQPLEGIEPVYLRYTLAEEEGQLKLHGGEKSKGSAHIAYWRSPIHKQLADIV